MGDLLLCRKPACAFCTKQRRGYGYFESYNYEKTQYSRTERGRNMKRVVYLIVLFTVTLALGFTQNAELPRLAVVEFSTNVNNERTRADAITVRNLVESQMVGTRKYYIVTRDEIDKLLANQRIQVSSISSTENIKKLQLENISYIITGSVDAMGDNYAITLRVLDVSNGRFSHSDNDFMGASPRDLYNGINGLMTKFVAGMSTTTEGVIVQGGAVTPSGISIEVRTDKAGDLYFQGEKIATLWDNSTHTIPIERPGTYSLVLELIDRMEKTLSVTITSRGITRVDFSSIQAVPRYAIEVRTDKGGDLYVQGEKVATLRDNSTQLIPVENPRTYSLRLLLTDRSEKTSSVTITSRGVTQVDFSSISAISPNMVRISGGTFMMGSPPSEAGRQDNETQRRVTVGSFYMGKHTVTVGEFRRFVNATGYRTDAEKSGGGWVWTNNDWVQRADANWRNPYFSQGDNHPVVLVSWNDAVQYANWLSGQEGLTPAYTISGTNVIWNRSANGYRLPTEAEWEYACRAGTTTRYWSGNEETSLAGKANVADLTAKEKYSGWTIVNIRDGYVETAPVGSFTANAWGLHDMHGNVWEWCYDWYGDYNMSGLDNPAGASSGSHRVLRGGSWYNSARYLRSAYRYISEPSSRYSLIGFRLVRP